MPMKTKHLEFLPIMGKPIILASLKTLKDVTTVSANDRMEIKLVITLRMGKIQTYLK